MPIKRKERKNKDNPNEARAPRAKKVCLYCENKQDPSYTDSASLRKFVSDRSKILPRARSGACSKHQRAVSKQIKYARHLSLLPFIARV